MRYGDDDFDRFNNKSSSNNIAEFVLNAYRNSDWPHTPKGAHLWVSCPFHGSGQERTGSRRVNLSDPRFPPGESFCFACPTDRQRKPWNQLARAHGLPVLDNDASDRGELWLNIPSESEFFGKASEVVTLYPWDGKPWRGIRSRVLAKLNVRYIQSVDGVRLYFPVYSANGAEIGHVDACLTGEAKDKYLLSSGQWSARLLWPINLAMPLMRKKRYVCIVEGQRDALKLIQNGVPALCTFGTNNATQAKVNQLKAWATEFGLIPVIAMDDDAPGIAARDKLKEMLVNTRFTVINFNSDKGVKDAGDMRNRQIRELRKILWRKTRRLLRS